MRVFEQAFAAFDGKSLEERVAELVEREELRELIARYAHCIANGRCVAHLFTEDGIYIQRMPGQPVGETRGRAAIAALYADWVPDSADKPKPMIHNGLLDIRGDTARGECTNEVMMSRNGQSMIGVGVYRDEFRREDGRWLFTLRDSAFYHWTPLGPA